MDRLTEMEAFATVVDQGGFTDAAKKMGISKSAVSKHVSALEARLGARLLNRTTRRVSPTEIGLAYYDRARRVLNDAGEADALVTSMQTAPIGLCASRSRPTSG
jgi:DNA-binding transcriptional LysR family regulator